VTPLESAILVAMNLAVPCGKSAWSVEPVPVAECAPDATKCQGARRSSFHGGWVRQQGAEACEAQRKVAARALTAELIGSPQPPLWAGLVLGVAVNESGLREDVLNGRGMNGKPADDGGQGRGPSGEVCWMQILPSMAKRMGYAPESLLGESEEALRRCFRAGLFQLRWARSACSRKRRTLGGFDVGPAWATIAMYGTGKSCVSNNDGKTERRVRTSEWMTVIIDREIRKAARS
jgi:hypothetical protein